LAGGEIGDLNIEVKWSCPCQEFCPGGDSCVLEVEVMTAEELLERYAAGERDFSGVTLRQGNLIKAQLAGINLSNATLSGTSFIGADLSESNLSGVCMDGGDFTSANLRRSNFQKASLSGVRLIGANCREANFSEAQMYRAFLEGATFIGANLRNADLGATSILGTHFIEADMRGVNLDEARGSANFTGSNLTEAIIPEIDTRLKGSIFDKAILPDNIIAVLELVKYNQLPAGEAFKA
jgi:uncharacterized protein YjbI with pentapeptide repeats